MAGCFSLEAGLFLALCGRSFNVLRMKAIPLLRWLGALTAPRLAIAALAATLGFAISKDPPPDAGDKITAALPEKPFSEPAKPRRLLVFAVTNGFRHASIPTGQMMLRLMGEKTGAFEAVVSDDLANFEPDALAKFDAVCFLNTTGNVFLPHKKEFDNMDEAARAAAVEREQRLKQGLMKWIRAGGGFVGIHSATDTCYEWAEYGDMMNGYFDGHPWGAGSAVSIKVEPGQEAHPLASMFEGQNIDITEEIYQLKAPYDAAKVRMLMRLDTERSPMDVKGIKRTDGDFGVSWARMWGDGRVFYTSLGHNHEIYWHPKIVRHYLAGVQWALGDLKADASPAAAR
jgi:type 1 glutamine amidotransferase